MTTQTEDRMNDYKTLSAMRFTYHRTSDDAVLRVVTYDHMHLTMGPGSSRVLWANRAKPGDRFDVPGGTQYIVASL